jgi:Mn2+/Fe2+ NRAMP family transporter
LTGVSENTIGPVVGIIILLIGLSGSYKLIERVMIVLITVMSITFVTTMVTAQPDPGELFRGAFVPSIPTGAIITVIAIVGTTVVPYNLFLHSENVKERWSEPRHLKEARLDVFLSIGLGGLITAAILITSGATIRGLEVESVADLALQLEPLLGSWATAFISIGLFAAGFSSALASPLGAAVTVSSVLKWERGMKNIRFKMVFLSVMAIGIISSGLGFEPLDVLLFAQALNGLILPFVSIMLLVIMNNKNRLGHYVNHWKMNLVGGIIVLICVFLGVYSIVDAIMSFTS